MPDSLHSLQGALEVLVSSAEALPATVQSVIDIVTPDLDEIYGQKTTGGAKIDSIWKAPNRSATTLLLPSEY